MTAILAVEIGGTYVDMPTPSDYECEIEEANDADRTVEYLLIKERIALKRQITVSWNYLSPADHLTLMNATGDNSCNLRYFDYGTGVFMYGTFYRGNDTKDKPILNARSSTGAPWSGTDFAAYTVSMSLTEF